MSQNNNNNNYQPNRIRGPTSALSSFLREQGIRVHNRSRRERRDQQQAAQQQESTTLTQETARLNVNDDSDPMEEVEETTAAQSSSSTTTGMLYRPGTRNSKKGDDKKTNKKKRRKTDSDTSEEDDDDEDDEYAFAPSSSRRSGPGRARIVFCDQCKGRFARKYDGDQITCNDCLNGVTSSKKKPATRKKQLVAVKKDVITKEHLPSLQNLCISVVAEYIDEVEAFGIISEDSLEKLAKIISRNRKMNDRTARLFMEPHRKSLSLYDCTNMNEVALFNVSQFCPRMEYLELVYCGHMTDKVLKAYADRLPFLKSLQLSGAFLVTTEAWNSFFEKVGKRLEIFSLRHSARFLKECIESLAQYCPNLRSLKLGHLNRMESDWLPAIAKLKKLTTLELAWTITEHPFKTEDVVHMLSNIGPQLVDLSIKGGHELDDKILSQGILKHCPNLNKLSLEQCDQLTSEAMVDFLNQWSSKGLSHLDISRCIKFDDQVLKAVIRHSGHTLKHLNIHSLELLTSDGLELLAGGLSKKLEDGMEEEKFECCNKLTYLDCGFVRSMDDFVLQKVINSCASLKDVQVWGCHMLTDNLKAKGDLRIVGRELAVMQ